LISKVSSFDAEKLNIKFVSHEARVGMLSADEMKKIRQAQDEHRELLNIPRRLLSCYLATIS
jgi:hypothetical protein